ncbi:MAG: hypothetical protein AB9834_14200 [Lentimicrobium sp.]
MKNYLSNLLALPDLKSTMVKGLRDQKEFMQKTILKDLEEIKQHQDGSLSDSDFRKITEYYGFAVPAILGEGFCLLRGKAMNHHERSAMTYLGALTGLFDDFFDVKKTSVTHIRELVDHPDEHVAEDSHELLFVRFFKKALENISDLNRFTRSVNNVFEAQILSGKQTGSAIERDEIQQITLFKGGFSLLFYRGALDEPVGLTEEKMLFSLGGISQLENDLFDVYKDYSNGIKTLATTENKIGNLRKYYRGLMEEAFALVHLTSFPDKHKKRFLRFIALIISRGFVCLDLLEKMEKATNRVFSLPDYKRHELICDMEKPGNGIKLINYYAKCNPEPN